MPHATTMCDTFRDFVTLHEAQLEKSGIPKRYWDTLFVKLKNEVFDAGQVFSMMKVQLVSSDSEDEVMEQGDVDEFVWQVLVASEAGIEVEDPQHVYLVDHAWTYRVDQARAQLQSMPELLQRMAGLMDLCLEGRSPDDAAEDVLNAMWKFNQTYSLGSAQLGTDDAVPIWYIVDEFGTRIQHSDTPTMKMVPFYYAPSRQTFSILWPLASMEEGDEATRNYVDGVGMDALMRKVKLLPWQPDDMTHLSYEQQEEDDSFYRKYEVHESLPDLQQQFPGLPRDRNVRVYTDVHLVERYLTDNRFELVSDAEQADIWWTMKYLRDFRGFSEENPGRFISQFPFEMVITVKDLLAMVARRGLVNKAICSEGLDCAPKWLQTTYNLKSELPKFVSYFQHREMRGLDNHWICKPWNLSRSLDTHITANLDYILRLPETGPKIACKYIEAPVLIEREGVGMVKFDLRFVLLLHSVQPVQAAMYNNFIVRVANKEFSLDHFDDYEKHFTVMNYKKGVDMKEILCGDFVAMFEAQYPEQTWTDLQERVYDVVRELLDLACSEPPPKGIGESPQSRAMYGVDVMFKWDTNEKGERYMQPVLFEVNFVPDTERLCKDHPDFLNDCFSALFLEDYEPGTVTVL